MTENDTLILLNTITFHVKGKKKRLRYLSPGKLRHKGCHMTWCSNMFTRPYSVTAPQAAYEVCLIVVHVHLVKGSNTYNKFNIIVAI